MSLPAYSRQLLIILTLARHLLSAVFSQLSLPPVVSQPEVSKTSPAMEPQLAIALVLFSLPPQQSRESFREFMYSVPELMRLRV